MIADVFCLSVFNCALVLEQIVEECIKVLVETCHQVTANDDRIVIAKYSSAIGSLSSSSSTKL